MTQERALEILKSGKNVFLTGEPGSGKTYTINQFKEWCREEDKGFAMTASTGIAATHVNGTTIHSWSGLKIKRTLSENFIDNLPNDDLLMERLNYPDVLIIDEVSMLDARTIQNIDIILRRGRGEPMLPFGGIQIVFVGDFFQLPPVVRGEPMHFAFEATAWNDAQLTICYLTEQHRQSEGIFLDLLKAMRDENITTEHRDILQSRSQVEKPDMHLYTHNIDVDNLNSAELAKIPNEEKVFRMSSSGIEYLVGVLKKSVLSPELLKLKIGAKVMFTRNNFEEGYVNGSIGTVVGWDDDGNPEVELDGNRIVPERAEWSIEEHGRANASVRQLPLRLAYAITVHKSQGMSLDSASIDLSKTVEYGQGYVAISRVRTLEGLHLQGINEIAFKMHPKVVERDNWFRHQSEQHHHENTSILA